MQITKIKEHIGAIVTGIDLRNPVDEAGFDYDHSQHRMLYRILVRGDQPC